VEQIEGESNEYEMLMHIRILCNVHLLYCNIYIILTKACHKYDHGLNTKLLCIAEGDVILACAGVIS
jgi:hypothetical protein